MNAVNRIAEAGQNAYSHARRAIVGGQEREVAPNPSAQPPNNGDENLSQEVLLQQSQLDISTIDKREEPTNLSARSRDVLSERIEPSSISGRQILEPISKETQGALGVRSEDSPRINENGTTRVANSTGPEFSRQRPSTPMSERHSESLIGSTEHSPRFNENGTTRVANSTRAGFSRQRLIPPMSQSRHWVTDDFQEQRDQSDTDHTYQFILKRINNLEFNEFFNLLLNEEIKSIDEDKQFTQKQKDSLIFEAHCQEALFYQSENYMDLEKAILIYEDHCMNYATDKQKKEIDTLLDKVKTLNQKTPSRSTRTTPRVINGNEKPNNFRYVISHKEINNTEASTSKVKTTDNSNLTPRITIGLSTEEAALNQVEQAKQERIMTKMYKVAAKIAAETNEERSKARHKVLDRTEKVLDGFLDAPMYPDKNDKRYLVQDSQQPHDPRAAEDHSAQQQYDPRAAEQLAGQTINVMPQANSSGANIDQID